MNRLTHRIRKPVKRQSAEHYLLLILLSFAASVTLTRFFLQLTGYPQLGGGGLHIAHVLWGGLLLFIASLAPLILANRWIYTTGAILAGVGVGLFIDEVGKFITQNNNYFYPPAAPIIYTFFLLTVLIYLQVRRQPARDTRSELYHVLDALQEILDHDLEPHERIELKEQLRTIAEQEAEPEYARLANELLEFLSSKRVRIVPDRPTVLERIQEKLDAFETRYLPENRLRAVMVGSLGITVIIMLIKPMQVLISIFSSTPLIQIMTSLVDVSPVTTTQGLNWFIIAMILEGFVGLILLTGAVLIVLDKVKLGVMISYTGLLISLTTVDVLIFYFEQFSTIIIAVIQLVLLLGVLHYRRHYLFKPIAPTSPRY